MHHRQHIHSTQDPQEASQIKFPEGAQGPTQLCPEGLPHGPPLCLVTLTLLVHGLHDQVHDVEQDPKDKSQFTKEQKWALEEAVLASSHVSSQEQMPGKLRTER